MTRPRVSDSDYRALARFRHALRVFQRFSEQAARAAGVTPAQHQLILAVRGWPEQGDPAISDLAEMLQLRHHSAVELIQRSARADLVETSIDPDDHRRQLVRITRTADQILESLSTQHRDELRRFRAEMNDVLDELG